MKSRKQSDKKYYESLKARGLRKLSKIVHEADYDDLCMIIDRVKSDRKKLIDTTPSNSDLEHVDQPIDDIERCEVKDGD